jgi:hypothetical protein
VLAPAVLPAVIPAASASDPTLLLEVLPFGRLRSGGQSRRFQVLPRLSAGKRDPAALDALVLQRLMAWLATHRAAWSTQPTSFTLNLSIASLEDERFVQKISAALNSHGISPETIGFEITEAVCTQRRAQVERFLAQCEKLGSWVVIDDFSFDSQVLPLLRSKAVRLVKNRSEAHLLRAQGQALPGARDRHGSGREGAGHPLRGEEGRFPGSAPVAYRDRLRLRPRRSARRYPDARLALPTVVGA